jgi:UPF0176 protein
MIINIAAYKFVPVDEVPALAAQLRTCAEAAALRGTVLVAPEGINLFLAGSRAQIDGVMAALHDDPRFADIAP